MTKVIASFSGGKDSTAMVLRMIERGEQLDQVVFCDTGLEFPAMYAHIEKVKACVQAHGVEFVTLDDHPSFEWYLCERPLDTKAYGKHTGMGWPYMRARWCTKYFKTEPLAAHIKALQAQGDDVVQCVGLAADEAKRIERQTNAGHRHPLAEWGWTEDMCLGYCYGKGYDWYDPSVGKGLYEIFDRTSCWICPLAKIGYLRDLRRYYPAMWAEIGRMEARIKAERERELGTPPPGAWQYKPGASWADLDARFAKEDEAMARSKKQTSMDTWGS